MTLRHLAVSSAVPHNYSEQTHMITHSTETINAAVSCKPKKQQQETSKVRHNILKHWFQICEKITTSPKKNFTPILEESKRLIVLSPSHRNLT